LKWRTLKSKRVKTQTAIARHFRVTPQAVAKWFRVEGFPYKREPPRTGFDLAVVARWRRERRAAKSAGVTATPSKSSTSPSKTPPPDSGFLDAKTRDMQARADVREMQLAKLRGEVMTREQFEAATVKLATTFVGHLDDLVETTPARLAGLDESRIHVALVEYRSRVERDLLNLAAIMISEADIHALKPHPGRPNASRTKRRRADRV
jgi:phage terminase Nu1 subunit (DNA packaging protein)